MQGTGSSLTSPVITSGRVGGSSAGGSASIRVENVSKNYGDVAAIADLSLTVESGEFVSLLGPSGSGKTTLLMAIAGFEKPDSGEIYAGDTRITNMPTHKRGLGVVFQRYALFPQMTVEENVGYALRVQGVPRQERRKAVGEILEMINLTGMERRKPAALSGGQQQRVALARALVHRPPIVLFDEPLGALDRKLREQLQLELRRLHRELGLTMLFVTHDQEEALIMSDRVAVMKDGELEQFGTGTELYQSPATEFVAGFLGRMNFVTTRVSDRRSEGRHMVEIMGKHYPAEFPAGDAPAAGSACRVALRPEAITLADAPTAASQEATVSECIFSGATVLMRAVLGEQLIDIQGLSSNPNMHKRIGDTVHLEWPEDALRAFLLN